MSKSVPDFVKIFITKNKNNVALDYAHLAKSFWLRLKVDY